MPSDRQIQANRQNSRKSRGPKTVHGKAKSCRNSLQHGLTLVSRHNPRFAAEIEELADALCGKHQDAELREYALAIAETRYILCAVREHMAMTIDRFRDPSTLSPTKGMKDFTKALKITFRRCKAYDRIESFYAKPEDRRSGREADVTAHELMNKFWSPLPRNEAEAICGAAPDLLRLNRYARRAWSWRRRAFRQFVKRRRTLERSNQRAA